MHREAHFQDGDLVWLKIEKKLKGKTSKLSLKWEGPYRIISTPSELTRAIRAVNNPRKTKVVHVSKLKYYVEDEVFEASKNLQAPPEEEIEIKEREPVEPEEELDSDPEVYEFEEILDQRFYKGENQYFVKWKGYTPRYNSWVDSTDLNAPDLLAKFCRQQKSSSL